MLVLSESKRQDEPLTNSEFDKLFLKLEALFNEKQIFKDPELRLNEVARQLGTIVPMFQN